MEAIIIAIIAYYLILLNRRQMKTKATPDRLIFASGIVMFACYIALLIYYYEITALYGRMTTGTPADTTVS
jgi:hypothetical protein